MIKSIVCIGLVLISFGNIRAQPVVRKVVTEHFTNTYCSVCASRNPDYHHNLFNFPQVLHVSYFPSAPYAACPINQENKPEHDARTNFYGIYGATPRIVIQGKVIPASADYGDTAFIHNELNKTSSFQLVSDLKLADASTIELTLKIIKKDTNSLTALRLHAVLVEDTLNFNAKNGEKVFYHVFKKSFSGVTPLMIPMPAIVGDTTIQTLQVPVNPAWRKNRMFAISVLQDADNNIIQADESAYLDSPTSIPGLFPVHELTVFPNPASEYLQLEGYTTGTVTVYDITGRQWAEQKIEQGRIYVGNLAPGTYWIAPKGAATSVRFIKW